jgi:diguanylate cyclase (GGDEF)-like protein
LSGRIFTIEEKCKACNKCIAVCPVDAANQVYRAYDRERKVAVGERYCISCGACIKACDHGARDYRDDTERFFEDLAAGETIHLVAAPAAQVNFPQLFRLFGWLKSLGVGNIYDVSLGADIATWAYLQAKKALHLDSMIAQPCPSIVNYCERYLPELLPSLAPIQSPLICLAIYLRQVEHLEGKIAFLSPCIAKADEIEDPNTGQQVAYNVTFDKLKQKLLAENIAIDQFPEVGFAGKNSGIGHVYSRPGGLSETVRLTNKDMWIRQLDSVRVSYPYLREYHNRQKEHKTVPELVEILNCRGGCNFGTGTDHCTALDDVDYKINARKRDKIAEQVTEKDEGTIYAIEQYFAETLAWQDFRREYTNRKIENGFFEDEDLEEIYIHLRKYTPESREINCHACGYGSCKRFAQAVKLGINVVENCISYERSGLLHDTLTPLLNHAGLEDALEQFLWKYQINELENVCVLMMDVDDFKQVNDSFGHDVGDEALRAVAQSILEHISRKDAAGRWGGDEFMIILSNTDFERAKEIAESIRESVRKSNVLPGGAIFTSSIGIAEAKKDDTPLTIFQRGDRALYNAKKFKKAQAK